MSVYLLEPPLTNEIIVTIFERLCGAEVRKMVSYIPDMQEGFQNGYIYCLTDFFGHASDEKNQQAYEKGESYIHVVGEIVSKYLVGLVEDLCNKGNVELKDLETIDREVSLAVYDYLAKRPNIARIAIQSL